MKFSMFFLAILCTLFVGLGAKNAAIEPLFLTRAEFARLTPQEMVAIANAGGAIMVEERVERESPTPVERRVAAEEPSDAEIQALIQQFEGVFGGNDMDLT